MSAPQIPNPATTPITDRQGNLRPEWVRYFTILLAYIAELEARLDALEP